MGFGEMIIAGLLLIPMIIVFLGIVGQIGAIILGVYYMIKAIKEKFN